MSRILVINGPNLNLLGTRQPEIYGSTTLVQLDQLCREWGSHLGFGVETYQSNHEGELIDRLQANRGSVVGVVINAGALTHYSYALHDAIESLAVPAVEVHISDIKQREPWRATSVISPACTASIYGRGIEGYRWGLRHLAYRNAWPVVEVTYGGLPDHVADLRIPEGDGPHPTAVLIHGGFWRDAWQRDTMDGVSVELARAGIATLNVEYRRVGTGGGWPQSFDDVMDAVAHLAEIGSEHGLDTSRVVAVGHSAGGQLALMAATRDSAVPVSGVVGLAPVADMETARRDNLGQGAVESFLGPGTAHGSIPWPETSPAHRLPLGVPQILIHGDGDDRVPIEMSRSYVASAQAAGDVVELNSLSGIDHFALILPRSPAWPAVAAAVTSLF